MVIIHLSDNQRRIISPSKTETLKELFKRFCTECSYSDLEYEFRSYPVDERVALDLEINANRVKEVLLVPKSIARRESSDSCYAVIQNSSPQLASRKKKESAPEAPMNIIETKAKSSKRSAPKPPVKDEFDIPDIEIPPPPAFLPRDPNNNESLYKSIECSTVNAESLFDKIDSTPKEFSGEISDSDSDKYSNQECEPVANMPIYMVVPHASQETLGSMDNLDNVEVSSSTSDSNVEDVYEMKENMIVLDNEESHNLVMNNDNRDNDPSPVLNHKTSLSPSNLTQEDNVYQLLNISHVDSSLNINANIIAQCEPIESGDEINMDKFITVQSEFKHKDFIQSKFEQKEAIQSESKQADVVCLENQKNQKILSEREQIKSPQSEYESKEALQIKLEHQEVIQSKLEHQEVIQSKLEHQEVFQSKLEHQEVLQSKLEHQEILQSKLEHQEVLQSKLEHQGVIQSKLEHQEALQSKLEHQEALQSKLEHHEVIQSKLEHQEALQSKLEHQEAPQSKLEHQEALQSESKHADIVHLENQKNQKSQSEFVHRERNENIMSTDKSEDIKNNNETMIDNVDGSLPAPSELQSVYRESGPLHHWELPKQGKTMQSLSNALKTNEMIVLASNNSKPVESHNFENRKDTVSSTPLVKVEVRETPFEPSDRPTYRPRQAKSLYFSASK